jgi:signal transduction histidine kinase
VPGLGLGLYLVRSIAELHGGRAGVEPAEGSGLRFWICLPNDETR